MVKQISTGDSLEKMYHTAGGLPISLYSCDRGGFRVHLKIFDPHAKYSNIRNLDFYFEVGEDAYTFYSLAIKSSAQNFKRV